MGFQAVIMMGLCTLSAPDMSAQELLAKCEAALDAPAQISFEAETQAEWADGDPESQETGRSLSRCVFRRDGQRFQAEAKEWIIEGGKNPASQVENRTPHLSYSEVWANGRYLNYQRATRGRPGGGTTSVQADYAMRYIWAALKDGKVLEGYLLGDRETRWTTIFREADQIEVTSDREKINDVPCIRMRCRTKHGTHTVWIDPERDHRARRIEVVRTGEDLLGGKPLTEHKSSTPVNGVWGTIREHRLIVENVQFERIGGHWIPVGVEIRDAIEYTNGAFFRTAERQTRKNVKVDAEAVPRDAFELRNIPEGAKFFDQDEKGVVFLFQDGKYKRHVYQGSKLVPKD